MDLKEPHLNFQLGHLPTEQPHPETLGLSELAQNDLPQALRLLLKIDRNAWEILKKSLDKIEKLRWSIQKTLTQQNRIYLCGCGATGRLSLSLDWMAKTQYSQLKKQLPPASIVSFMAGGDSALVSALEGFEDYPELGKEHLQFMGFKNGDLLIASTEGGETPYVIGATLAAAELSSIKPWFLYCNPREQLISTVERSAKVLTHPQVENIELFTGPMALAGSTRMQASSVLMAAIGLAIFEPPEKWDRLLDQLIKTDAQTNLTHLEGLVIRESDIYKNKNHSIYITDRNAAMTVFTDTTERAPTFSLNNFDHPHFPSTQHSLSYVSIEDTENSKQAWLALLGRPPVTLNRPDLSERSTQEYLNGFDFSKNSVSFRKKLIPDKTHIPVSVLSRKDHWLLTIENQSLHLPLTESPLYNQLLLKSILNTHSTLLMGRLERYTGNLMTYVKPTNGKLIDRATRYILILLQQKGKSATYDQVRNRLLKEIPHLQGDEPIVLKVLNTF